MSQMQVLIWDALDLKVPQLSVYFIGEISLIRLELGLCFGSLAQIGQDESDKRVPAITRLLLGTFDLSRADKSPEHLPTPPSPTPNQTTLIFSAIITFQYCLCSHLQYPKGSASSVT